MLRRSLGIGIVSLLLGVWLAAAVRVLRADAPAAQPDTRPSMPRPSAAQLIDTGPYHLYAGSTHAHTSFTWSHGDQWKVRRPVPLPLVVDPDGTQHPPKDGVLKPDWEKVQGPPSVHFSLAKQTGYDFDICTDHSQEAAFQPPSPTNENWVTTLKSAVEATDPNFVAIAGYEHSENNGPNGEGHLNVINSAEYLNALSQGVDLPYLYNWLKTAKPNGDGPIVASFNHPGPHQYNDWAYRDPQITDIITMLEVINSNNKIHYEGFINALDKGWKVSPVCGNDNHGLWGITHQTSRTFVLATERTKPAILDAMQHRRTYATLAKNLQCVYTVNGSMMGSTLEKPDSFEFNIFVADPDTDKPADKITKIDIVKDGGVVAETYTPPTPDYAVTWKPTIRDQTSKYFFVRIWNAAGGDAPGADPAKPVAWLAPVWTGR